MHLAERMNEKKKIVQARARQRAVLPIFFDSIRNSLLNRGADGVFIKMRRQQLNELDVFTDFIKNVTNEI